MKINILLCDTFPGLLPPQIPSYAWMFTHLFDSVSAEQPEYQIFRTMDGELPPIGNKRLNIITGCNLSAYDNVGWIKKLLMWIVDASANGTKILGICFGHQAIAQALGGKVVKAAVGWGTGVRESTVVDEQLKTYFPDGKMHLLYNHHDQVVELPKGATLTATSAFCPVEGFRVGNNVLAFQGHPEYLPDYSEHLLKNFADDEPAQVREAGLKSLQTQHQGEIVGKMVLEWAAEE